MSERVRLQRNRHVPRSSTSHDSGKEDLHARRPAPEQSPPAHLPDRGLPPAPAFFGAIATPEQIAALASAPLQRQMHVRVSPAQPLRTWENPLPVQRADLGQRIRAAQGGGNALDSGVRQRLEGGLKADLSGLRVHADGESDALSQSVQAVAFTTGQDVFFRSGAYRPESSEGMRLLAHEATHTVQQARGPVSGTPIAGGVSVSDPADSFEQAAENAADRAMEPNGLDSPIAAQSVQRSATGTIVIQRAVLKPLARLQHMFADQRPEAEIRTYLKGHAGGPIATDRALTAQALIEQLNTDKEWHEFKGADTWTRRWNEFLTYLDGELREAEVARLYREADNAFENALRMFTNKEEGWKRPDDNRRYKLYLPTEIPGFQGNWQNGHSFRNDRNELPRLKSGTYTTYDLPEYRSGGTRRGARRVVEGPNQELYYTDDHYDTWVRVVGAGYSAPYSFAA